MGLVIALAALVAAASNGAPVWTLIRSGHADRIELLTGLAIVCLAGGALVAAAVLGFHRVVRAGGPGAPSLRTTMSRAAPAAAAVLAALGLAVIARTDLGPPPPAAAAPGHVAEESGRTALPLTIDWWGSLVRAGDGERDSVALAAARDSDPVIPFQLVLATALLVILLAAVAWRRLGSEESDESEEADDADEHRQAMHGAFVGTIDAMLADPDPNTAIRGAYARLLEGLAESGARRFSHEAPVEHLHRVLTVLDVRPEPLRELIGLFEVARFSTQPLRPSHRERALGALRAVATDLESGRSPIGALP